jgi:hypothetical protein
MRREIAGLTAIGALFVAGGAWAHHAFVMFDVQKEVNLQGVVKDVEWASPHIRFDILVRNAAGVEADWPIEGGSPATLRRMGWTSSSLRPGDHVEMLIHPRKDGSVGGIMLKATIRGQVVGEPPKA